MIGKTNSRIHNAAAPTINVEQFSYYATHLDELATVLDAHYAGTIDLTEYWSVGDTIENISLSSISASSLGSDSQSAQNVDFVILDFNHDTLSSDTSKKAVLTLGQKDSLSTTGKFYSSYNSYTYARYTNSARRSWLNSNYYGALPSGLQSLIKPVQKVTAYPTNGSNSQTTETTSETCWLASNMEIFGTIPSWSYAPTSDGTQYPYYSTQSNRIKKLGKTGSAYHWWSRSGYWYTSDSYAVFVFCYSDGSQSNYYAHYSSGLAPCFSL